MSCFVLSSSGGSDSWEPIQVPTAVYTVSDQYNSRTTASNLQERAEALIAKIQSPFDFSQYSEYKGTAQMNTSYSFSQSNIDYTPVHFTRAAYQELLNQIPSCPTDIPDAGTNAACNIYINLTISYDFINVGANSWSGAGPYHLVQFHLHQGNSSSPTSMLTYTENWRGRTSTVGETDCIFELYGKR